MGIFYIPSFEVKGQRTPLSLGLTLRGPCCYLFGQEDFWRLQRGLRTSLLDTRCSAMPALPRQPGEWPAQASLSLARHLENGFESRGRGAAEVKRMKWKPSRACGCGGIQEICTPESPAYCRPALQPRYCCVWAVSQRGLIRQQNHPCGCNLM